MLVYMLVTVCIIMCALVCTSVTVCARVILVAATVTTFVNGRLCVAEYVNMCHNACAS